MTIPADDAVQNQAERARVFRALHEGPSPLLLPNPWDVGSARLLASLGFAALATTSGGFAATLGRLDGAVTRDEALGHAALACRIALRESRATTTLSRRLRRELTHRETLIDIPVCA